MEEQEQNCCQCDNSVLCKPYKDICEALGGYNLITKHPGKVWSMVVEAMAENCRHFKQAKDSE
jgi:hypothetical protein